MKNEKRYEIKKIEVTVKINMRTRSSTKLINEIEKIKELLLLKIKNTFKFPDDHKIRIIPEWYSTDFKEYNLSNYKIKKRGK